MQQEITKALNLLDLGQAVPAADLQAAISLAGKRSATAEEKAALSRLEDAAAAAAQHSGGQSFAAYTKTKSGKDIIKNTSFDGVDFDTSTLRFETRQGVEVYQIRNVEVLSASSRGKNDKGIDLVNVKTKYGSFLSSRRDIYLNANGEYKKATINLLVQKKVVGGNYFTDFDMRKDLNGPADKDGIMIIDVPTDVAQKDASAYLQQAMLQFPDEKNSVALMQIATMLKDFDKS
jgi:hypothetical protein